MEFIETSTKTGENVKEVSGFFQKKIEEEKFWDGPLIKFFQRKKVFLLKVSSKDSFFKEKLNNGNIFLQKFLWNHIDLDLGFLEDIRIDQ